MPVQYLYVSFRLKIIYHVTFRPLILGTIIFFLGECAINKCQLGSVRFKNNCMVSRDEYIGKNWHCQKRLSSPY